jgi:hypothetical protein
MTLFAKVLDIKFFSATVASPAIAETSKKAAKPAVLANISAMTVKLATQKSKSKTSPVVTYWATFRDVPADFFTIGEETEIDTDDYKFVTEEGINGTFKKLLPLDNFSS